MKKIFTSILFLCCIVYFPHRTLAQQVESTAVKSPTDTSIAHLKKAHKFKAVLVWAVKEKGPSHDVITTAYTPWLTQQEAIDGITKMRNKSWDTLQKEGAQLIQRKMFVEDNTDSTQAK